MTSRKPPACAHGERMVSRCPPQFWWLSFVDRADDAELGSAAVQLGVAIVIARDMSAAVQEAWAYRCNPGGEVAGMPLGFGAEVIRRVPEWRKLAFRLLQEPEITEAQLLIEHTAGTRAQRAE